MLGFYSESLKRKPRIGSNRFFFDSVYGGHHTKRDTTTWSLPFFSHFFFLHFTRQASPKNRQPELDIVILLSCSLILYKADHTLDTFFSPFLMLHKEDSKGTCRDGLCLSSRHLSIKMNTEHWSQWYVSVFSEKADNSSSE